MVFATYDVIVRDRWGNEGRGERSRWELVWAKNESSFVDRETLLQTPPGNGMTCGQPKAATPHGTRSADFM